MSDIEWVECPHCNGKKMEVPDCEECEGRGWVDDPDGGTMACPECNGESCSVCDGEGYVDAKHIQVDEGESTDFSGVLTTGNETTPRKENTD